MRKCLNLLNLLPSPWFPTTMRPGISGPVIFGNLIGTGNVTNLFIAYLLSAGLMIFAALVEIFLGVRAEGQSLENVARPLTAIEEGTGTSAAAKA
jgi:hypothetical protein